MSIEGVDELILAASRAREMAYAPYSKFAVGAALRARDGRVFTGANVENATYGLTVCAERTAVLKAVSEGILGFDAICVVTDLAEPAAPCGMCRQTLYEFAHDAGSPSMYVILANLQGRRSYMRLAELQPLAFGPRSLIQA